MPAVRSTVFPLRKWLTGHGQKLDVGLKVSEIKQQRRWRCRDHVGFLVLIRGFATRIVFWSICRGLRRARCDGDDGRCQESAHACGY